jgi:twitching motility protein PilT
MTLEEIIRLGVEQRATDIHLEPLAPITLRLNGGLKRLTSALDAATLKNFARRLLSEEQTAQLRTRGSTDLCRTIAGVPCRINVLSTDRGTGFAIRLLSTSVSTLSSCNLHPSLLSFVERDSGLVILTGPTGSGKSTTLAALIEEINSRESRHIITLENPIEYRHQAKKSLIRQREIGRNTPSFDQGLLDSLREDPDVLVVGEMREAEAMRLTLNAAETGHLVLATMHSASAMDAIYRIMMSFPAERQSSVLAQLADSLIAVVSHRMTYRAEENILVPRCEILVGNYPTKNVVRKGDISKLTSILQTGGPEGMFSFERYQAWLDEKTDWSYPPAPTLTSYEERDDDSERDSGLNSIDNVGESLIVGDDDSSWQPPVPTRISPVKPGQRRRTRTLAADRGDATTRGPAIDDSSDEGADDIASSIEASFAKGSGDRTPASRRPREKTTAMKIHKDGRIEIPEVDLDLEDLVKEFKNKKE